MSLILTVGQHHTTAARSASRVESPLICFVKCRTCTFGMQPELGEAIHLRHANVLRTFYSQPQGGPVRTELRESAVKTGLVLISFPPVCSWVPRSWPSAIQSRRSAASNRAAFLCGQVQPSAPEWPRGLCGLHQGFKGIAEAQRSCSARTCRTRGDGSAELPSPSAVTYRANSSRCPGYIDEPKSP